MSQTRTREEKTSADDKALGFDYQFYYFIFLLLGLEEGQTIGLEVKDDVHIDIGNDHQFLYQLKHSVQTSANGEIINLTTKDSDLWKTLSNWSMSISDPVAGRGNKDAQFIFCSKTTFILATNKSLDLKSNYTLSKIVNFQKDLITFDELKTDLIKLISNPPVAVDRYIQQVCNMDEDICTLFIRSLRFEVGESDIISRIKSRIKSKQINESRIDAVLAGLESSLRQDNYLTVLKGDQNLLSFDVFHQKYCRHFELARQTNLRITRNYDFSHSDLFKNRTFDKQLFVQQLLELGDIDPSDLDGIISYTKQKLMAFNNMESWLINGDLTSQEKIDFADNCVAKWRVVFRKHNRKHGLPTNSKKILTQDEKESGILCVDELRSFELQIDGQELGVDISNGQYYLLAEELLIGWAFDFEMRYGSK
jgi:hypothetical protein